MTYRRCRTCAYSTEQRIVTREVDEFVCTRRHSDGSRLIVRSLRAPQARIQCAGTAVADMRIFESDYKRLRYCLAVANENWRVHVCDRIRTLWDEPMAFRLPYSLEDA